MIIFPLAPDQTIAQMWSNGARGREDRNIHCLKNDPTLQRYSSTF